MQQKYEKLDTGSESRCSCSIRMQMVNVEMLKSTAICRYPLQNVPEKHVSLLFMRKAHSTGAQNLGKTNSEASAAARRPEMSKHQHQQHWHVLHTDSHCIFSRLKT